MIYNKLYIILFFVGFIKLLFRNSKLFFRHPAYMIAHEEQ